MKLTLKGIRNNLNLSQEEMAKKLGISRETYQSYETFKTFPDYNVAKKIINLAKIDFNDIIFLPINSADSVKDASGKFKNNKDANNK